MNNRETVKKTLEQAISGAQVEVLDPRNDDCHLEAIVVAQQFEGLPLIEQHQLVMGCLKSQFEQGLHALSLKTYTPQGYNERANPS